MAANKRAIWLLAKTIFFALPCIVAIMFGVHWFANWMLGVQGIRVPNAILTLIAMLGIFAVISKVLGRDLRAFKRANELEKKRKQ